MWRKIGMGDKDRHNSLHGIKRISQNRLTFVVSFSTCMIPFHSFTLANGLQVFVHPNANLPKVVVNLLYKVGSKDEDPQRTGFAHLFEHLMFEGSRNVPNFNAELEKVGGECNAFTSVDITNYYITLPANQLEVAFWLESDRMLALNFSEERLENQKGVVIQEYYQRYENQPYGLAYQHIRDLHFDVHPYKWTPIGKEMRHVEEASLQEVEDFFYGYYAPNNAVLVVAGDVSSEEVQRLSEKWFGDIPARTLKKHAIPQEAAQQQAKFKQVYDKVPHKAAYKMYHIPAYGTRAYFVADLLTDLLSAGKSGKLFQDLVKQQQLTSSVSAFVWSMCDPGALSINAKLSENVSFEQYEQALAASLAGIEGLKEVDLARIKRKVEADAVYAHMHLLDIARNLAFCASVGDAQLLNTLTDTYQSITLAEIKAAARTYFAPENSSTLYYVPQG